MSGPTALAAAHLAVNEAEQALEILKSPTLGNPTDAGERLLLIARAQHELGRPSEALGTCEDLVGWLDEGSLPRILHSLVADTLTTAGGLSRRDVYAKLEALYVKSELTRLTWEIESGAKSVAEYQARAKYFSRIGRWHDSADDLQHAVKLDPENRLRWLQLAPVLILAGKEQRYEAIRQELTSQFRGTEQPDVADVVCKVALLRPQTADLSDLPVKTLRDGTTDPTWAHYRIWFTACCALISYREGDARQALEWTQKAGESTGPAKTLALVVQAMSEHRLGQSDQARSTLAKAESNIPLKLRKLGTDAYQGPLPVSASIVHHDWLIAEILRREAESLFNAEP